MILCIACGIQNERIWWVRGESREHCGPGPYTGCIVLQYDEWNHAVLYHTLTLGKGFDTCSKTAWGDLETRHKTRQDQKKRQLVPVDQMPSIFSTTSGQGSYAGGRVTLIAFWVERGERVKVVKEAIQGAILSGAGLVRAPGTGTCIADRQSISGINGWLLVCPPIVRCSSSTPEAVESHQRRSRV